MHNTTKLSIVIRLLLRLCLVFIILYGLYLNTYAGFGAFQPWLLLFYTTQSNFLVMLVFLVFCIADLRALLTHTSVSSLSCSAFVNNMYAVKTALTWAISITGIVWHLLLVSEMQKMAPQITAQTGLVITPELWLSLDLLHTGSPLLAFLDWLLFSPKGKIKWLTPVRWLIIPLSYFVFICCWVNGVGPVKPEYSFIYPYPFLDFQANGVLRTWLGLLVILLGMLGLGYLYLLFDRLVLKVQTLFSSS